MMNHKVLFIAAFSFFCILFCELQTTHAEPAPLLNPDFPTRLPQEVDGKPIYRDIVSFWGAGTSRDAEPYAFLELMDRAGTFEQLVMTFRRIHTFNDPEHPEYIARLVKYALEHYGLTTQLDLDVRIARKDLEAAHPDRLMENYLQQELPLKSDGPTEFRFKQNDLSDHYTANYPYFVRRARFIQARIYEKDAEGNAIPETIRKINDAVCFESSDPHEAVVVVPKEIAGDSSENQKLFASVGVSFAILYPDVFSNEAFEAEKALYERYKDVPAVGTGKDEWGMPPSFNRENQSSEFWFSDTMTETYAQRTGGRSLTDDFFLMQVPQKGREEERAAAFDAFNRMILERVLEYEWLNYRMAKKTWGPNAFVGVHGTWYPWPNTLEFRKNGLMWWKMPRDFAHSDEFVPFCCRTAMAKATDSYWVNMFYATEPEPYIYEHWTAALAGGRVDVMGLYPRTEKYRQSDGFSPILASGLPRVRSKIRLLNFAFQAPIQSEIGVVFGHFGAMNPIRNMYGNVGDVLCDAFSEKGFPADLIPSDEIQTQTTDGSPRWIRNSDGFLQYGAQAYRHLVFFGMNDSDRADFEALRELGGTDCCTKITEIPGESKKTFDAAKYQSVVDEIVSDLENSGIPGDTPWEKSRAQFVTASSSEVGNRPPLEGFTRCNDGSFVWVNARENALGDPIHLENETVVFNNGTGETKINADCNGILACRFDASGNLEALAAAELKFWEGGGLRIELDAPLDVTLWKDASGSWKGVFQGLENDLPEALKKITPNWRFLEIRPPFQE